ncbi:IS66-like element accessory protein TnpA [Mangrovicoccus algicola]|uniref:Transposase n=1 Tax=Mangrovicoccus algicola TaxID=2771008 RepID=A0A8J7CJD1_9RHOB|nr:transposase [Mangrovicoccus algicola]MBE3640680.1 transposase [Mangrovicoccus algicola]
MRHEVFTGPERRRRWSFEAKLAIIEEVGVNGWTVSDVARRHDVGRQNIYHWRRELRREGLWPRGVDAPVFLPVELAAADSADIAPTAAMASRVGEVAIVLANGRQLRCRADLPEAELSRLIRAIEAA